MRQGVAEVDQQTIAEILRDMAFKAGNYLGAGLLIGAHHLAQVFGIELAGEYGRVYQVTKQYSELAAFGVRRTADGWEGVLLLGRLCLVGAWLYRLRSWRG